MAMWATARFGECADCGECGNGNVAKKEILLLEIRSLCSGVFGCVCVSGVCVCGAHFAAYSCVYYLLEQRVAKLNDTMRVRYNLHV